MASINDSFNIDDLLDDLNVATTTSNTRSPAQSLQNSSAFPSSSSGGVLSRDSVASGVSSTMTHHLPHPPQDSRHQGLYNPKTKFAVATTHNNKSIIEDDSKLSLDQWLDNLSPSPPKASVNGTFQPSSSFFQSQHVFSPEEAKKNSAQMFAQFGLATTLSPVVQEENSILPPKKSTLVTDKNETVSDQSYHELWDSSWDESPVGSRQTSRAQQQCNNNSNNHTQSTQILGSTATQKTQNNHNLGSSSGSSSLLPSAVSNSRNTSTTSNTQKSRCCRVVVAGPFIPRGLKNSAFSKVVCDNLLCSQCNFKVLFFPHGTWANTCDYMYFRNNMPNIDKLTKQLIQQSNESGEGAYCCQCSWLSVSGKEERSLVYGVQGDPQWICSGHTNAAS